MSMPQDEYLLKNGNYCPECREPRPIMADRPQYKKGQLHWLLECSGCGLIWTEIYKLAGYQIENPS